VGGLNVDLLPTNANNTEIYRMMYASLIGRYPGKVPNRPDRR
jgi:hypothetical protein